MLKNNIKNLKILPTSLIVFYKVYNDQSAFSNDEINEALNRRLISKYKLDIEKSKEIVSRDQELIRQRGSNLDDYIFNVSKGLGYTTDALYGKLKKSPFLESSDPLIDILLKYNYDFASPTADDLTFSELCLGTSIMSDLKVAYQKRNNLLKRELKRNDKKDILKEYSQIENEKMIEFYEALVNIFLNTMYDFVIEDDCDDKVFHILKNITTSTIKIMKESNLCIGKEEKKKLQTEFASYRDLSCDVISIDENSILKNEETAKIYKKIRF